MLVFARVLTPGKQPASLPAMNNGNNAVWQTRPGSARRFSDFAAASLVLATVAAFSPGCSVLQAPQKVVNAVVPVVDRSNQPDPAELQTQIQRFSDDFFSRTTQSLDNYAAKVGTEQGRVVSLQLKLASLASMLSIASGPNPNVNLLDQVSAATLTRMMIEDYWLKTPNGPAFASWYENSRRLETNAWELAASVLKPAQVNELREGIAHWYKQNPELQMGFLARPQEFASMVRTDTQKQRGVESVFNLVNLDPTAGLDPAVREVTRSRLFAERAMFTVQRMPFLMRWQMELLGYELTSLPEVRQVVTNTTRLSESTERISQVAAELPDHITTERKAILAALELQEGKLRELAAEVNRTLASGAKMSDSLNTTITTFDGLMKRFGVGEPDTNSVPDTNSPPFNILDYGKVAGQIGGMSRDLNTLLTSANQSVTQLTKLSDEATARADRLVDRAFHRGIALIVIFLVGAVLAGLTYRKFAKRVTHD
jgi:hypothetical protein